MKRHSKLLIVVYAFVVASVVLVLIFCMNYKSYLGKRPVDQPGTTWVSEDKSIVIYVDKNHQGRGTIDQGDNTVPFIFTNGPSKQIEIYSIEAEGRLGLYSDEQYELWWGEFFRDDYFVATVRETTFFTVGESIAFYRLEN